MKRLTVIAAAAAAFWAGMVLVGCEDGNSPVKPEHKIFTITFDANGGTVSLTSAFTGADSTLASLPEPASRDGYIFLGWFTKNTGGTQISTNTKFVADTTIYARWMEDDSITYKIFTITFDANGGTVSLTSAFTGADSTLASLPEPSPRTGYIFAGWFTTKETGGYEVTTNTKFDENTTIYAKWTEEYSNTDSTFTDSRDGKTYRFVTIGEQTWMAENLNYAGAGGSTVGVCNNNDSDNCAKYGRLYTWSQAISVCPSGWHLPSDAEWAALTNSVGANAGTKLKSTSGWYNNGNGTDDYGFSALPGGYRNYSGGDFSNVGVYGLWWSATEYDVSNAWGWYMDFDNSHVLRNYNFRSIAKSVRCVKN